ncbi:DUF6338 family protein [Peribacillus sp. SCS-26]|uniref:DUF6338 family protein n=1 Tax=Paraperibacillus marinus TaxID=3115295 RepID=UPI0039059F62
MEFSEFAVRLLLIFFPGMLAVLAYEAFTRRQKREFNVFITYSFLFGFLAYFSLYLLIELLRLLGIDIHQITFLEYVFNSEAPIAIREVIYGSLIALIFSVIWSYGYRYKWMQRIAVAARMSKQFHEKDVWSEVFNMEETPWVVIRDYDTDRMFQGWVAYYSDSYQENELFLRDVIVYENTSGRQLYEVPGLYLTRDSASLHIEFQSGGVQNL